MPASEVMQLASLLIGMGGFVVLILNVVITLHVRRQSNSMKDELVEEVRKNSYANGMQQRENANKDSKRGK